MHFSDCKHILSAWIFLLATLSPSAAQTYKELYKNAYIAIAAVKQDGSVYAMKGTHDGSHYYKQLVKLNSDNEIVYLASEDEYKVITWHVWIDNYINLKSESENERLHITRTTTPALTTASDGTDAISFNTSYNTFTYTKNNKLYGITLYGEQFSLQSEQTFSYTEYPLARPYFMADHTWRTLGSSSFGTVCFPKAVRADERAGATFYEIDSKITDNGEFYGIILQEVEGELAAGVPYIFKKDDEATYIVAAQHGEAAEASSSNGLVGTLTGTAESPFIVPAGKFVITGDQLIETTEGKSALLAGRAYIDPSAITKTVERSDVGNVKGFVIGTDSSYDKVNSPRAATSNRTITDIHGRQVTIPRRGQLYLVNGRKIMSR